MNKNTPVIMGVLLILGIVALGYFADLDNQGNNSTNNSNIYSIIKNHNLTNQTQSDQKVQSSTSSDKKSHNNNTAVNNTNTTSQNKTANSTE